MKIYPEMIEMVKSVAGLSRKVAEHDPDLARQMKRSSSSVPLNAVEGWHAYGGNRTVRFNSAMREARETITALEISVACGYLRQAEIEHDLDRLDHFAAAMWKLSKPRR
jgi:four helix bundle protein